MEEKFKDLIPWLKNLLETLLKPKPDGDDEEVRRRSELEKSVLKSPISRPPEVELS